MIIGVDLAPTPIEPANVPENCQFEIDDITLGLDHYWGQFDVVHARFIVGGLKNFRKTMNESVMPFHFFSSRHVSNSSISGSISASNRGG